MTDQRTVSTIHHEDAAVTVRPRHASSTAMTERLARPHSREEAEERYVAARESWAVAMRTANSGKPSDMAALALAQDAYESALAERNRWTSSSRIPIPVEADRPRGIGAIVGQEMSWRRVHELEEDRKQPTGIRSLLGGFMRRRR